jgi:hypothetical protein
VALFRTKFNTHSVEEIAFPRGLNGLEEYRGSPIYKSGTPIHVRAALLYNHHLKRLGLDAKYELLKDGDKLRFVYLKMPNPLQENIIAFTPQGIPTEFKLDGYIDYDRMFENTFLSAVNTVAEPIGWRAEEVVTLDDFFG